jgi:hypothetical protein
MKRLTWVMAIMALLVGLAAQPAGAALVLNLTIGNAAIAGFPGPYGTATISLIDATHASIVFSANTVAGNQYLFGDGGSAAVNFNGAVTLGTFAGSNAGVGFINLPGDYSSGGAGVQDGFGSFNSSVNIFDGFSHAVDNLSFIATKSAGSWVSDADVVTPNGSGFLVSAHIFVTSFPANRSNGAIATGFATNGEAPPIPEPTSVVLLGLGLASSGMGFIRRRRRK